MRLSRAAEFLYKRGRMSDTSRVIRRARVLVGALALSLLPQISSAQPAPVAQPAPTVPAAPTSVPPTPTPPADPAPPVPAEETETPPPYGGPVPPAHPDVIPPRTDLAVGQKRGKQDYDGRPDQTTTGEDALWIPRILFFPLYVVTEFFVRAPLGALVVAVEKNNVIGAVTDFLTFGPNNNIGFTPSALIDFGFRPSVGLYFFWNDFIVDGNDLRAFAATGGEELIKFGIADRIPFEPAFGTARAKSYFQVEADFLRRGDLLFWGIGPDTLDGDVAGYGVTSGGGGGRIHVEPWRGTFFEGWVTSRLTHTDAGECSGQISDITADPIIRYCNPKTIRRKILDGDYPAPEDFGRPYSTVKSGIRFVLDSRKPRPVPGHGVAIDLSGEHVSEHENQEKGGWLNWGGSIAGFVDLTETQRVLSLKIAARFQDVLTDGYGVPFTELLGVKRIDDVPEQELMRGFRPGRLVGSSEVAATLEYHWPIWAFLDGTLQTAIGNAFEEPKLGDFDFEKLRFSFVGGIRSINHRDHSFNLLLGFGTETFEEGGTPNSLRFLFGGTTGF